MLRCPVAPLERCLASMRFSAPSGEAVMNDIHLPPFMLYSSSFAGAVPQATSSRPMRSQRSQVACSVMLDSYLKLVGWFKTGRCRRAGYNECARCLLPVGDNFSVSPVDFRDVIRDVHGR